MDRVWILLLPFLFWYMFAAVPVLVIARRSGISRWLTLISPIPFFAVVIALWVFAVAPSSS